MYTLKLAYRSLFIKGQFTITRIISLAAGLAFGLLLLAEVFYHYSYDRFYPDANRIYTVQSRFKLDKLSDKFESYPSVSGAIAPGMKAEVPGIEAATRLNSIGNHVFYTDNQKSYKASFSLADEYLFDVLPRPMINGNPVDILKRPMACMVSSEIADAMGGNVIGEVIELKRYPGKKLTVSGVFEALPENTNYQYDILISMISTEQFFSWDGSTNWLGNDRYYACVKLMPGINPENLEPAVRKMQEKHQDIVKLEEEQGGLFLKYAFQPIKKIHSDKSRDMVIILSTIALAVLFVSLMNYILLTLNILIKRAKASAIHKTCGAQTFNLQQLFFSESFLLFLLSIIGALLIIGIIQPFAEVQLGHPLVAVLNPIVIWPVLGILFLLIGVTSYLPGRFFSRIPVTTAFKNYNQKKNKWKLALLAFQFVGATFIVTVMVIVTLQYDQMKNADHGYRTKGIYYGSTTGIDGRKITLLLNELRKMPEIKSVGLGTSVPLNGASGNNVRSLDKKRELFNVGDFYSIDENYFSILEIPVTQGQKFTPQTSAANDVLISEKGAGMLQLHNGWDDGVTGKQISISEHGSTTICGVFPDFIIGSLSAPDNRPSVFFYLPEEKFQLAKIEDPSKPFNILIKVHEGSEKGIMNKIAAVFNLALPQNDAVIKSLEQELLLKYADEKGFRNAMLAGNIIILLITMIGLLGYTTNEATRRQKELAIRRINGAKLSNILRAFIIDLQYTAIQKIVFNKLHTSAI
ncbi:MAG: ABC transporter permease [Marinilabiliaceae bacterium]|nr:ABC transporter permease [Marinilabiliaceae bacterium]